MKRTSWASASRSLRPLARRYTRDVLVRLKEHKVEGLGLSLDGSTPERHDSIRGFRGLSTGPLQAMRWAQELGMPLQVNTLVAAETAGDIPAVYELLKQYGVARWSLFFLISVGRGKVLQPLSAEEGEKLMAWIHRTSQTAPFIVATTEAPSYRRVALELMRADGMSGEQIKRSGAYRGFGIRDGHGIMFVSHTGDICPAGFLPLVVGNIRKDQVSDVYRTAPVFQSLHDPGTIRGTMRILRIQRPLRRVAGAGVRGYWRSAGLGSVLHVPAVTTNTLALLPAIRPIST